MNFIGGLPRSGTTLLANILAQDERNYVSPTSGISSLVGDLQANWKKIEAFQSEGLDKVWCRIPSMLKAIIEGYYAGEIANGKQVFDKSRGWNLKVQLLEALYGKPVRVLFPVRNVNEIIISFEKAYSNSIIGNPTSSINTVYERAATLLDSKGTIGQHITAYRDLRNKGLVGRLIVVKYKDLLNFPKSTLARVHEELGLDDFAYDFDNVEQCTEEYDSYLGYAPKSLHSIRSKVEKYEPIDYTKYLPSDLVAQIDKNYADINELAK